MITPTLLELAKSDDNSIEQFAKGAQKIIFDKEIGQTDYDEMLKKKK